MAQTSNLKDLNLTGLDTVPPAPSTTGEGASGYLKEIDGFVTALSADNTTSKYRLCRVKTNIKVKEVKYSSAIATAGNADLDIAYSDAPLVGNMDGSPPALAGTIVQVAAADNKLFGAALNMVAQTNVDTTSATSRCGRFLVWPRIRAATSISCSTSPRR
jgi:hypothetical protein